MRKNLVAPVAMALVVPVGIVLASGMGDGMPAAAWVPLTAATVGLAAVLGLRAAPAPRVTPSVAARAPRRTDDLRPAA